MISTFFGLEKLVTAPTAGTFLASLVIGLLFGFSLEYAGFGSSRKLAGIFYFRDMTVLRVMFTAMITAMLGLSLVVAVGWIDLDTQVYLLPSVYGAQIVGGLIFGVGFVMSGWCPGTGVVGLASGKIDALVFLVGVTIGAILFNETYAWTEGLRVSSGVQLAFGMDRNVFALLFTLAAVVAFYLSEYVERAVAGGGPYLNSALLRTLSVGLVIASIITFILPAPAITSPGSSESVATEQTLLEEVELGSDHVEPAELANMLMPGAEKPLLIDLRPAAEFESFHLPGAVNVQLPSLIEYMENVEHEGRVVLYSNGMVHPVQGRDALTRLGFQNVQILTDGLQGFLETCLKPASLRSQILSPFEVNQVHAWRSFFLAEGGQEPAQPVTVAEPSQDKDKAVVYTELDAPRMVSTEWLNEHLDDEGLRIIDCRTHADYTRGHIPGSVYLNYESVRGVVGGVPSVLLPTAMLVEHLAILGVKPGDMIVLDPGENVRDATLISMALERVGHRRWGILHGGFPKWVAEQRPVEQKIPHIAATDYPAPSEPDPCTVDASYVAERLHDGKTVIIDTRPAVNYTGEESNEMRAGHIPGAVNVVYKEVLDAAGNLKPVAELAAIYQKVIPSRDAPVVVYCRTGHQASLTFFVLKEILGYQNAKWYDASWTDWAASEFPAESG